MPPQSSSRVMAQSYPEVYMQVAAADSPVGYSERKLTLMNDGQVSWQGPFFRVSYFLCRYKYRTFLGEKWWTAGGKQQKATRQATF